MREIEKQLAALTRRQFGVFSRRQAIALGLPAATLDARVARGRYRVLLPGVYAEAGAPDSVAARAMAAQLAVGGDAVLARGTAGIMLGLDLPDYLREGMHLLVRHRTFEALPDLTVHRTANFDESDIRLLGPLRVTSPTRTIADIASDCGPIALRRTVADAVRPRR